MTDERRAWLDLALAIADEADLLALGGFRRDVRVETKPDRTLVSETDQAIERMVRERIRAVHPDHGLVGEEYGTQDGDARVRWYIDPIDGTHNFVRGVPVFATLLAVEREGELEVAVISAPALGERWFAWRGGGAWAVRATDSSEPQRIHTSGVGAVADSQVLYGSQRDIRASGRLPGFDSLLASSWRDRGFGDFWGYVLVAEGAAEVMIDAGLAPWDAAAPALIVEESGGRLTDVDGRRGLVADTFVATNGVLHDEVLRRLRTGAANG